jgi:SAM-dependent methyltransferase
MTDMTAPKEFWERKILRWERRRYSHWLALYPLSWSVRARLRRAHRLILQRVPRDWSVLELGCGSGLLAERLQSHVSRYQGVDIARNAIAKARERVPQFSFTSADVLTLSLPNADLTVFLGLTDWLDQNRLPALFGRIQSPQILFSYTESSRWNPYRLYRALMDKPGALRAMSYSEAEIRAALSNAGYAMEKIVAPTLFNPGAMVWARRLQ